MISSTTQQDDDQVPLQELRFKTLKRRWYMLLICGLMGTLQVCMCFVYLIICILKIINTGEQINFIFSIILVTYTI